MNPRQPHPTDLELELARTAEAYAAFCAHVARCPECSQRMTTLRDLSAALRRESPAVEIPELVEARILRQARRAAARPRHARRVRQVAVAAAAVVVLALTWILRPPLRSPAPAPSPLAKQGHPTDLNGDGVTDVLDAYDLAKRIEAGGSLDSSWDLDDDGRIDRRDADLLAMTVVRIDSEIRW